MAWIVAFSTLGAAVIALTAYLVIRGVNPVKALEKAVLPGYARYNERSQKARVDHARVEISVLGTALELFEVDCNRFPTMEEGLQALAEQPSDCPNWNKEGYLPHGVPKDPWGNPYVYKCPGVHNPTKFDLYSLGPDGRDGTEDDIGNWTHR